MQVKVYDSVLKNDNIEKIVRKLFSEIYQSKV